MKNPGHCLTCGRGMYNHRTANATHDRPVSYAGRGLCTRCYRREKRGLPPVTDTTHTSTPPPPAAPLTTPGRTPTTVPTVLPDTDDSDWRAEALCAQTDPTVFFPERNDNANVAKRICKECPVRTQCLQWALDNDEQYGIWGGISPRKRAELKRRGRDAA